MEAGEEQGFIQPAADLPALSPLLLPLPVLALLTQVRGSVSGDAEDLVTSSLPLKRLVKSDNRLDPA